MRARQWCVCGLSWVGGWVAAEAAALPPLIPLRNTAAGCVPRTNHIRFLLSLPCLCCGFFGVGGWLGGRLLAGDACGGVDGGGGVGRSRWLGLGVSGWEGPLPTKPPAAVDTETCKGGRRGGAREWHHAPLLVLLLCHPKGKIHPRWPGLCGPKPLVLLGRSRDECVFLLCVPLGHPNHAAHPPPTSIPFPPFVPRQGKKARWWLVGGERGQARKHPPTHPPYPTTQPTHPTYLDENGHRQGRTTGGRRGGLQQRPAQCLVAQRQGMYYVGG